jgi:hypothetical protein
MTTTAERSGVVAPNTPSGQGATPPVARYGQTTPYDQTAVDRAWDELQRYQPGVGYEGQRTPAEIEREWESNRTVETLSQFRTVGTAARPLAATDPTVVPQLVASLDATLRAAGQLQYELSQRSPATQG